MTVSVKTRNHKITMRKGADLKFWTLLIINLTSFFVVSAQIGIGVIPPTVTLDSDGALSLRNGSTITLSDGTNNNISLGTPQSTHVVITGPTTSFTINGIIPISGNDGQVLILENGTPTIMTIRHENTGSTAENRIYIPGEKDFMVRGENAVVSFRYNASQQRWILLNRYNHVETWYSQNVLDLPDGTTTTVTITSPGVTPTSGIQVSLYAFGPVDGVITDKYNLLVEYIEAQNDQFIFRVNNLNPDTDPRPSKVTFVQALYSFTIVK